MTVQINEWVFPQGSLARAGWEIVVDELISGWKHTALRVTTLSRSESRTLPRDGCERVVIPLAGSFEVAFREDSSAWKVQALEGRRSVFDGPTDVLFIGADTLAEVRGNGRVAVAEARTTERKASKYNPRELVGVELRGAGISSRQVHNFATPGTLDASRIIACEVITPAGNWSSYPSHKHDQHRSGSESRLEEIYYFEAAPSKHSDPPEQAVPFGAFFARGSNVGELETNARVQSGDVALVPFGFHGPAIASPEFDLYYLNVMAGPDLERAWMITDDPAEGWIRERWRHQSVDERLPFSSHRADIQTEDSTK